MPDHLYFHTPYCSGKCAYCAFYSQVAKSVPLAYLTETLAPVLGQSFETIYFGGGTPALIGPAGFDWIAQNGLHAKQEWTVELHPAAVTPQLLTAMQACGVNRLSIGVQSFNDTALAFANRRHTAQQALTAIQLAQSIIPDTGIDLIAGLPHDTPQTWQATLDQAITLDLPHYSIYSLSIETGSAWQNRPPPDDDLLMDAIDIAQEMLATHGIERYETSNYAKAGFTCRHNLNTWQGGDYLGLGPTASSRIGLIRQTNPSPPEVLSPEADALERALTTLRLNQGFHPDSLIARYPILAPYHDHWQQILTLCQKQDLLTSKNAPTTRGYEVLDTITRLLVSL